MVEILNQMEFKKEMLKSAENRGLRDAVSTFVVLAENVHDQESMRAPYAETSI
jgi:hypothetical protein